MSYLAMAYVRETGAILHEPIVASSDTLALRIAREWARENALKLTNVCRLVSIIPAKQKV